jgi:ATP-dependent RNA helicase DDX49/DBP8
LHCLGATLLKPFNTTESKFASMSSLFHKSAKRKHSETVEHSNNKLQQTSSNVSAEAAIPTTSIASTFADIGLCSPLVQTCRKLGYTKPTPVQRAIIPLILNTSNNILTLSATGSGKTASFALPLLHNLSFDPYGIYAIILTPTRELAKQIQQQILALGSSWKITVALIIGGSDLTNQSIELSRQPNFVVATPGRLAELCRDDGSGLYRPNLRKVKFVVLDEADRLLAAKSGFERDVAEVLLQSTTKQGEDGKRVRRDCRTLLFSATMTRSLKSLEEMAGAGVGKLPLTKVVVRPDGTWDNGEVRKKKAKKEDTENSDDSGDGSDDSDEEESSTPNLPAGLLQEYIFMPSRVREAYLLCAVRNLMTHGGRAQNDNPGWSQTTAKDVDVSDILGDKDNERGQMHKSKYPLAQSAIIFVPTCERAAHISGILTELGIKNVALHSLLSQNRRLASLGTFQSQQVRVLVATGECLNYCSTHPIL